MRTSAIHHLHTFKGVRKKEGGGTMGKKGASSSPHRWTRFLKCHEGTFGAALQGCSPDLESLQLPQTIGERHETLLPKHQTQPAQTQLSPTQHNPLGSSDFTLAATSARQPFVSLGEGSVGSYLRTGSFPLGGAGISA